MKAPFKFNRSSYRLTPEPSLALINVSFLLIIYFLVIGTLGSNDMKKIDPIESSTFPEGTAPEFEILILQDGRYLLGAEYVTIDVLQDLLRKKDIQRKNSIITIKPDKNVKYGQLSDIMRVVGMAGANKIVLISRYRKQ